MCKASSLPTISPTASSLLPNTFPPPPSFLFSQAKKAEALLLGQPLPKEPTATLSPHLQQSSEINLTDGGTMAEKEATQQWCLFTVGFRAKHDAELPRCPSDVEFAWQYIMCKYCLEARKGVVRGGRRGLNKNTEWKQPKFPSFEELYLHHHLRLCPYFTPKDQGEWSSSLMG